MPRVSLNFGWLDMKKWVLQVVLTQPSFVVSMFCSIPSFPANQRLGADSGTQCFGVSIWLSALPNTGSVGFHIVGTERPA